MSDDDPLDSLEADLTTPAVPSLLAPRPAIAPLVPQVHVVDLLADVLARIAGHPAHRIDELLPWNWRPNSAARSQAA